MSSMFLNCRVFDGNIINWNTSNVTNMSTMFLNCEVFNKDLSSWNVNKVSPDSENFSNMFLGCDQLSLNYPNYTETPSDKTKWNKAVGGYWYKS